MPYKYINITSEQIILRFLSLRCNFLASVKELKERYSGKLECNNQHSDRNSLNKKTNIPTYLLHI